MSVYYGVSKSWLVYQRGKRKDWADWRRESASGNVLGIVFHDKEMGIFDVTVWRNGKRFLHESNIKGSLREMFDLADASMKRAEGPRTLFNPRARKYKYRWYPAKGAFWADAGMYYARAKQERRDSRWFWIVATKAGMVKARVGPAVPMDLSTAKRQAEEALLKLIPPGPRTLFNPVHWERVPGMGENRMWRRSAGSGYLYVWIVPKAIPRYGWEVWTGARGAPSGGAPTFKEAAAMVAAAYKKYLEKGGATLFNPREYRDVDAAMKGKGYRYKLTPKSGAFDPLYAKTIADVSSWLTEYPREKFGIVDLRTGLKPRMLFNRNADPRFEALAEAQRGKPEGAMMRLQMAQISQLYGVTAEHVGDLTHRMSQQIDFFKGGYQWVEEKVRKTLRWLTNPYGFEREVREQVVTNFNYMREHGDPYARAKHFGRSPQEALLRLKRLGRLYAAEHRKLPVFNAVQRIARAAAIAVGEWRFKDAVDRLYQLKYLLDQGHEVWAREAMKTKNNPKRVRRNLHVDLPTSDIFTASPYGLTPNSRGSKRHYKPRKKTFFVARFRPPYPQKGEFWTASTSIDTLPATVVGGVYKVSAPSRVSALAQARMAHARGR